VAVAAQTGEIQHLSHDLIAACGQNDEGCCVTLEGRITIDSSPDLRTLLLSKLDSVTCRALTLDFGEVTYIDTSGLAVLLELLKVARHSAKRFTLSGLQEKPRYLLEATRLLNLFEGVSSSQRS
jgi:anti-sigma B factor antagonist